MVYPALLPLMRTPRLTVVDWTDVPRRFKWTRPFRRKTKSGFRACAITFQTYIARVVFHQRSSSTSRQDHVSPCVRSCCLSAAISARRTAVPRHPCHGFLPNSLSKKQSDEHLMLGGQKHCPAESCDGLSCVAGRGRVGPALLTQPTKMYIHPSQSFNVAVRILCCPRWQEVHKRLQVILSKHLRVTGNHPRRTPHFLHAQLSTHPAHPCSQPLPYWQIFFSHCPSPPPSQSNKLWIML